MSRPVSALACSAKSLQARPPGTSRLIWTRPAARHGLVRSNSGSSAGTDTGAGGSGASEDAGAAFVQRFRSLSAEVLASAQPLDVSASSISSGCCGGSAAEGGAAGEAGGSCCGGSSSSAPSGQAAAAAAMSALNSLMSGMEGSLSREDMQAAFQAGGGSAASAGDGGERFLDVAAILRGEGAGAEDDEDADLDALVV